MFGIQCSWPLLARTNDTDLMQLQKASRAFEDTCAPSRFCWGVWSRRQTSNDTSYYGPKHMAILVSYFIYWWLQPDMWLPGALGPTQFQHGPAHVQCGVKTLDIPRDCLHHSEWLWHIMESSWRKPWNDLKCLHGVSLFFKWTILFDATGLWCSWFSMNNEVASQAVNAAERRRSRAAVCRCQGRSWECCPFHVELQASLFGHMPLKSVAGAVALASQNVFGALRHKCFLVCIECESRFTAKNCSLVVTFIEAVFGRKMAGEVPRSVLRSDVKCLWGLGWEGHFGKRECWSLWKMSIALKDELCDLV